MNGWLWFWTISLVVAGTSFAFITLVVTIKGASDLQQWFSSLQRQNKNDDELHH
ncbi:MAG TPA: hypothetical protein VKB46_02010 [Pyrinomonadaceae bacterium]|nr:hypothetical protein [Pyrinomonadaceae bacterium]